MKRPWIFAGWAAPTIRVDIVAEKLHLKMEMGSCHAPGSTHCADAIALLNRPDLCEHLTQMPVQRTVAVAMVDDDCLGRAVVVGVAGEDDSSRCGGEDRRRWCRRIIPTSMAIVGDRRAALAPRRDDRAVLQQKG